MDTVLGVSMAPTTVRIVLVEGENGDGVTVDEDNIAVAGNQDPATFSAPDQVVSAILGTREGAGEAGYELRSTGVTWTDQRAAAELRDALAARKVENVMLVSSFLAAAALAQSLGSATGYARNALLYVEPDSATLAVVNTADGAIMDVQREQLPDDDDQAVATLVNLVSAAEALEQQPEGLLVVGSGVDIPLIKPALEDATSLPLSVPDHPETALARGAALASAHAPLFASSTAAVAYALDPGTGSVSQHAGAPGYLAVAEAAVPSPDAGADALAYSAVADDSAAVYTQMGPDGYEPEDFTTGMYPDFGRLEQEPESRRPFLVAMGVLMVFVTGVMGLVISLAFSIRPSANTRPSLSHNVVAPAHIPAPAPAAPPAPAPAAAPVQAPAPAPAPIHAAVPAPAPPRVFAPAPAPPPVFAPAPAPAPPPIAPIIPPILPGLLSPPGWGPPHGGDEGPWGHGGGPGWGHGGGGWGHGGGGFGHGGGHGRW
ncbi:MAG TPA: hypothetical protein VN741_06855 [Mycobacterium sp.]|nr:hypothetical protein [Mycobacterium sp.]